MSGGQQPNPAAYTILSAQFANAGNTAAIVTTREAGDVAISAADTPALWAKMQAQLMPTAYVAPTPPTAGNIAGATIARDAAWQGVAGLLAQRFGMTAQEVIDAIKAGAK